MQFIERNYSNFTEVPDGFMVTSTPSDQWKRLTAGQKLLYTLYKSGKIAPSQVLCDLFNNERARQ